MDIENITIQEAVRLSMDNGNYPDYLPADLGSDFKLKTKPEYFVEIDDPRTVKIEISSFSGLCGEAIHYYAAIVADGVNICSIENGQKLRHSGYLGEEFEKIDFHKRDVYSTYYKIDVGRFVTKEEIDKNPERWHGYCEEDRTSAFYTEEDAIKYAKMIIDARFAPEWKRLGIERLY